MKSYYKITRKEAKDCLLDPIRKPDNGEKINLHNLSEEEKEKISVFVNGILIPTSTFVHDKYYNSVIQAIILSYGVSFQSDIISENDIVTVDIGQLQSY